MVVRSSLLPSSSAPRARRPLAGIGALALVLVAAACGGGGSDGSTTSTSTSTSTDTVAPTTAAEASSTAAIDVCALLDGDTLASAIGEDGGDPDGWMTDDGGPEGSCAWRQTTPVLTISIEVHDGIDETIGSLGQPAGGALVEVPVGASAATGERDDASGRLRSLYVPAGADSVLVVGQLPLALTDDQLVAVAEAAAIAFENGAADVDGSSSGDDETASDVEVLPPEGVDAVRFTVQSADAGLDLELEVTADEVAEGGNPIVTGIVCTGAASGSGGLFDGLYAVSAIDADREEGLVRASVEADDEVTAGGTYEGTFEAADGDGRSVEVQGTLTIDDGLRSGELAGDDDAGNDVRVTWECLPLG